MKRRQQRGSTLVETLTIVAVITLLAAILFPVCAEVRARARQASCAGNLHQIARAGLMYLADYDERFPSCYRSPSYRYAFDLPTTLQPYLHSEEPFYCPERHTVRADCIDWSGRLGSPTRCLGYGYNWGSGIGAFGSSARADGLVRAGPALGMVVGVTLVEVTQPAHCLFLGDTNDHDLLTLWRQVMPGVRQSGPGGAVVNEVGDPYEPPRHRGGNNFAFVDGHVKWLRFPGGRWVDGGPWVIPDMDMYSRSGSWEPD